MATQSSTSEPSSYQGAEKGDAANFYSAGEPERELYLQRARRLARVTVPCLFREKGANASTNDVIPWTSMGSYGVNSLSAKETLAFFPSGLSFIKLKQSKKSLKGLAAMDPQTRGELKAAIDEGLSQVEREFTECVEEDGDRVVLFDAKRHMIVGGNHCIKIDDDSRLQSIPLERYVVYRDKVGRLLDWCVLDEVSWAALDEDVRQLCVDAGYVVDEKTSQWHQQSVKVYTRGSWTNGKWKVYQECWGQRVPGTDWTYNEDSLPYLFLREIALEKEHYGRSYCEDYEGDLTTLDAFWQIITEGAGALAILKWLVKPGGVTNKRDFADLPNGGVMTGNVEDVSAARADKGGDMKFAVDTAEKIEQRLEKVFLLFSSIQRNGERVTAEEISTMRQDIETTTGGVYANASVDLQAPYAKLKFASLQRQGRITTLPKGAVNLTILTGEAGIGRQAANDDLDAFMLESSKALLQNPAAQYVDVRTYLQRKAANRQIDTDGFLKTQDQVDADTQQQQQAAMAQNVAPEVVKQGGQMIQNAQTGQAPTAGPQDALPPAAPAAAPQAA